MRRCIYRRRSRSENLPGEAAFAPSRVLTKSHLVLHEFTIRLTVFRHCGRKRQPHPSFISTPGTEETVLLRRTGRYPWRIGFGVFRHHGKAMGTVED